MKKLLALIASFAIMLVTASAFVDKRQEASLGEESPMLVVNSGDSLVSLDSFQGCWVILSFLSLIHISEPTRHLRISYSVFGL